MCMQVDNDWTNEWNKTLIRTIKIKKQQGPLPNWRQLPWYRKALVWPDATTYDPKDGLSLAYTPKYSYQRKGKKKKAISAALLFDFTNIVIVSVFMIGPKM